MDTPLSLDQLIDLLIERTIELAAIPTPTTKEIEDRIFLNRMVATILEIQLQSDYLSIAKEEAMKRCKRKQRKKGSLGLRSLK